MARQRWVPSRVDKYLRRVSAFQLLLLLCIHFTGGMPGRSIEIGSIKWCNTRTALRNVFMLHGRLLVVLEYQKAQYSTNRAFYVVRALPPLVSQLLFCYLAFVQPFAESLSHQTSKLGSSSSSKESTSTSTSTSMSTTIPYIFATSSGMPFQAPQLTAALKKLSERTCSSTLTAASY